VLKEKLSMHKIKYMMQQLNFIRNIVKMFANIMQFKKIKILTKT